MSWQLIAPGRWRWQSNREEIPPARSLLPAPHVISDEMPPTEQVDGRFYTSKRKFRAVGRALGLTEVGNEKFKPKTRASASRENRQARHAALAKAAAEYRQGRRPQK